MNSANRLSPLNVCVAGIGGYGKAHHTAIHELEKEGVMRLLATCDPQHAKLADVAEKHAFAERGVAVLETFEAMLDGFADRCRIATLATPIKLHAPMHAACLERGLACYLEKPPTLDPAELARMIALDRNAKFETQVGYAYIVEPWRQELKRRLLEGEFGRVQTISYLGAWQRDRRYYTRASWAGRLLMNGELLLDSCFGNAMSHHIHNLLFFAGGKGVFSWAEIGKVRAELYRANPIEGADTVFSEAITEDGIRMRAGMSHATSGTYRTEETIVCEKAEIRIIPNARATIRHASGRTETMELGGKSNLLAENFRQYAMYVQGRTERPLTRLADSQPFVTWNALNYIAAGHIRSVEEPYRQYVEIPAKETGAWEIPGVEEALTRFVEDGVFPSVDGLPWARPGGEAACAAITELYPVVSKLAPSGEAVPL